MHSLPIVSISSVDELDELELKTRVFISGVVDGEREFGEFRILEVNGVTLTCECPGKYLGKDINVMGIVGEFNGKKQVNVLRMNYQNI